MTSSCGVALYDWRHKVQGIGSMCGGTVFMSLDLQPQNMPKVVASLRSWSRGLSRIGISDGPGAVAATLRCV